MPYSWIGLSHRRIFLFARHRSSSFFSLIYCFFSARDCEDLLQIWRLAKVSTPETSYAFHPVRPKPISVREPSYDKPSALDKPPATHDLAVSDHGVEGTGRNACCVIQLRSGFSPLNRHDTAST